MRILFLAPLLFLAGCSTPNQKAAGIALREAHIDPSTTGTVSGRVLFSGQVPKARKLDLSANPTCERQHLKPVYSEELVINKNGTLRNTLVWIKTGLPPVHWPTPATPATMDQEGCVYRPHVLALMAGQSLEVTNSDPLNHNVHAEAVTNPAFNVAQPPRAEKLLQRFDREEFLVPFTCGVHPWMKSYVSVIAHPFFAVTGDDGRFRIEGLPPGTYVAEAVHESLGRLQLPATLGPNGSVSLDFTYATSAR